MAARGIATPDELGGIPADLLAPAALRGIDSAATLLADAIARGQGIVVVADYDCDGATACAVMVRGLRMMGARVDYLVPNRFEHGYGLTPPIAQAVRRHPRMPDAGLIVTVDNGIASIDGVRRAHELGLSVLITDHHLPAAALPEADAIVNPNQPDCHFASKHLAGVGVAFYCLLALRARLREQGAFGSREQPALQTLFDLIALGTVADLVRLDRNNRILVAAGLARIRAGRGNPGICALLQVARRAPRACTTGDLGFAVGPRLNAAGRLSDITIGIECLLTDDPAHALALASELDQFNRERREQEARMREQALDDALELPADRLSAVLHRADWHEGIVGLVASRLKDRMHRPVFAFAPSRNDATLLKGSGRSIPGIHLRDVLDLISKRDPSLIERFGGHAMAAGLSLRHTNLGAFEQALERAMGELADPSCFVRETVTDGPIPPDSLHLGLLDQIEQRVWGQGFPEPLFSDRFRVRQQRLLKDRHLKLELMLGDRRFQGICFERAEPLPEQATLAYRLLRNEYRGSASLELQVVAIEQAYN